MKRPAPAGRRPTADGTGERPGGFAPGAASAGSAPSSAAASSFRFTLGPTDRTAIFGRTGSGKTTLARLLVQGYRNLVAIDPKHRLELPGALVVVGSDAFRNTWPQRTTRVVFRPAIDSIEDDTDAALARVYQYGRTAVLVDESLDIAPANRIIPAYKRVIRLGRELVIPTISCSQRPRDLHNDILGNVEHLIVFDLPLETDRRKVASIGGDELLTRADDHWQRDHGFAYSGPSTRGRAVWCPPLAIAAAAPAPLVTDGAPPGPPGARQE